MAYVPLADQDDAHALHDPDSFVTKYIWSQDHKVIAIQYGGVAIFVGLIALGLSILMRLQLGFPDTVSWIDPAFYYQAVTMHGMIMVVYLLTALFLGGFGNYLIPLMCGARDMVFPFLNMLSFWFYFVGAYSAGQLFCHRRAHGCRVDIVRTAIDIARYTGIRRRHIADDNLTGRIYCGVYHGRSQLCDYYFAGPHPGSDTDAAAAVHLGHFYGNSTGSVCISGIAGQRHHAGV